MRSLSYKLGLKLSQIHFIKSAINDKADLAAFDHKPTVKLVVGLLLIILSNALCWPTITALTGLSVYHKTPWLAAIGGPLIYITTFAANALGMTLAGAKYVRAFFRWFARISVEHLLQRHQPSRSPETNQPSHTHRSKKL